MIIYDYDYVLIRFIQNYNIKIYTLVYFAAERRPGRAMWWG
jgi:hypothetical protein